MGRLENLIPPERPYIECPRSRDTVLLLDSARHCIHGHHGKSELRWLPLNEAHPD